jgi:RNA-directed DNA polymerase
MMRAIEKHVPEKWIRLYIQRWLESPVELAEGGQQERCCGVLRKGENIPHFIEYHYLLLNLFSNYN